MGNEDMVNLYIMGVRYEVPGSLTIMKALEHVGIFYTRGCGCRGGVCGACITFYRNINDYHLKTCLACQTQVEDGMVLTQLSFFPANRANHVLDRLKPTTEQVLELYPELAKCLGCGSCTKVCPVDIDVMGTMAAVLRGDFRKAFELSYECIMCGLCTARCPAELSQYNISLLVRRLYGRYIRPPIEPIKTRAAEIESGQFNSGLAELRATPKEELARLHKEIHQNLQGKDLIQKGAFKTL